MIRRVATIIACSATMSLGPGLGAQGEVRFSTPEDAREALDIARRQQRNARARGELLEKRAAQSREAADKATQQAAALAARVQQAEAAIGAAEARFAIATDARRALDRKLAVRREPLVRLTGALQSMSRRPLVLSALKPGSLQDLVYTRAVLDSTIPVVRQRTAALRSDLDRARALEGEARKALSDRRESEAELAQKRKNLVVLAEKERLVSRQAAGGADREARRVLVLAEQTRDLDTLVGQLEEAGSLRTRLAALPGPLPRPADPSAAKPAATSASTPAPRSTAAPDRYQLPVAGRIAYGFGEASTGGARKSGIALIPRAGAQVVAPGEGRIAFAGPYRGYGDIVIVEHRHGWTSLVTGLAALDVTVGQEVTNGSPLGLAGPAQPEITLELRRDGEPVNPLDHLR